MNIDNCLVAMPDTNFSFNQFEEIRTSPRMHLALLVHHLVVQHIPGQLVSLIAQGPYLQRDLVLLKTLFRIGRCNSKDHLSPTHDAYN